MKQYFCSFIENGIAEQDLQNLSLNTTAESNVFLPVPSSKQQSSSESNAGSGITFCNIWKYLNEGKKGAVSVKNFKGIHKYGNE